MGYRNGDAVVQLQRFGFGAAQFAFPPPQVGDTAQVGLHAPGDPVGNRALVVPVTVRRRYPASAPFTKAVGLPDVGQKTQVAHGVALIGNW